MYGPSPPQTEYEKMALSIVERAKLMPKSMQLRYTSSGMKRVDAKLKEATQKVENDMLGMF